MRIKLHLLEGRVSTYIFCNSVRNYRIAIYLFIQSYIYVSINLCIFILFFAFKIFLLTFRERGRKRGREIDTWMENIINQLSPACPLLGISLQPAYVP